MGRSWQTTVQRLTPPTPNKQGARTLIDRMGWDYK